MNAVPLGQLESETLEFKAAAAIGNLFDIGREVVAFLNAGRPADLWIGLAEGPDGRAVGVEPVDVARVSALENHLHDTIYPHLASELQIERVSVESGEILRLRIEPSGSAGPFAQLKQGGWYFFLRVGARVRPMEHQEIAKRFREGASTVDVAVAKAFRDLVTERESQLVSHRSHLWVGVLPVWAGTHKLGEERIHLDRRKVDVWLRDPRATGNREAGWNFANPYVEPKHAKGTVELSGGQTRIEMHGTGLISFTVRLDRLVANAEPDLIATRPICEFPTSVLRLLRTMLSSSDVCPNQPAFVLADIALTGATGRRLGRVDGQHIMWELLTKKYTEEGDITWPEPIQFDAKAVQDEPDRCAMRLVARVYEAFGFREDGLPALFDRASGRLTLD